MDPQKREAIVKLHNPETEEAVRSFLGVANYVSRFIPRYSHVSEQLRNLTKKTTEFAWTPECQQAVDTNKMALIRPPALAYFNPNIPTKILVDASPVGLAEILTQRTVDGINIIAFTSKAVSATEQFYCQLEREALAVVWGCQHFHFYIFGKQVTVLTLVHIFNKAAGHRNIRLERLAMKLTMYDAAIVVYAAIF